jgi:hypothetical protein
MCVIDSDLCIYHVLNLTVVMWEQLRSLYSSYAYVNHTYYNFTYIYIYMFIFQITMWQRGNFLGIIGWNHRLSEVYFAQPDLDEQESQVVTFRFLTIEQKKVVIPMYLKMNLFYKPDAEDKAVSMYAVDR